MFSSPFVIAFALFVSLPLLFLFGPAILPPKHPVSDDPDDLALFRHATRLHAPPHNRRVRVGATNPNPKIAFLFLTNSDLNFAPLWEKFFSGKEGLYNIYVHADPTVRLSPPGGVFEGRFVPAKRTARASPTLISAARRLLANALIDDPLNLYFALLSQHCVPIHSFGYIHKTLFGAPLIRAFSAQSRHTSFIEVLANESNLQERYSARGDNVMLPEVPFEKFRTGSQFFVLAKRHALTVIRDRKLWSKFRLPCLNLDSCYPEEHYFPTLLSMKDPKGCSRFTLTRVNWTDSTDGHPHTYLPEELSPQLVHTLRESNSSYSYFFARKFSPECLTPLMELADDVLFRD